MLDELERLAREANAENDDSSDWFCADLIESNELISSSRKARRYIAAANPATVLKLIAVARAAESAVDGLSVGLVHTLDRFCGTETSDAIEIRKLRDSLREAIEALKGQQ